MRPFVGPAGQQFNNLLSLAGISRAECYVTNTFKTRPPRNDATYFHGPVGRSGPLWDNVTVEGKEDIRHLYDELDGLSSNVFVALGNVPMWALTRHWHILKWRGSILSANLPGGKTIKVIPTIHPAAILPRYGAEERGNYLWRYSILHDLHRVSIESASPDIVLPEYDFILRPSAQEALDYIRGCKRIREVALDIEVSRKNHELLCFALARDGNSAMCIPLLEDGRNFYTEDEELDILIALAELCEDESVVKIIQNASYEFLMLNWLYGIEIRPIRDTMVQHGVLFPDLPKSLAFLTSVYTKQPYYKYKGAAVLEAE